MHNLHAMNLWVGGRHPLSQQQIVLAQQVQTVATHFQDHPNTAHKPGTFSGTDSKQIWVNETYRQIHQFANESMNFLPLVFLVKYNILLNVTKSLSKDQES